jgi:o-succinylbenzoate---CoA ligase
VSEFSLLAAAREAPAQLALVDGEREIDFGELGERVRERLRQLSTQLGSGAETRSSLLAFRAHESLESLELIYALLELGQPFLPLHARLTDAEVTQLLVELPVAYELDLDQPAFTLRSRSAAALTPRARRWFEQEPQLAALATSGSSGAPRVVLLSRSAFRSSARASAANLGWLPDDRWLLCLPLAHIGGLSVVTRCLSARRPVVLPSAARAGESSAQRIAAAIVGGRASLLSLVPTQLSALLQLAPPFELPTQVRAILTGGAAASPALCDACAERHWPVLTSYGATEACSQITTQQPGDARQRVRGTGRPLAGVELRLAGGAIQIRGSTLFTGYLLGPEQPFDPDGWFSTGDLGRFDADGQLHVLGRSDQMIISGGENVSPAEVEAALEACPGVLEACVFPLPDAHWGQLVAAGLRLGDGEPALLLEGVRAELERRLANFKRPRRYVLAQSFVYGPTGKLDRRATAAALLPALQGG